MKFCREQKSYAQKWRGQRMSKEDREKRAITAGNYIKKHKATIRETARVLNVAKTTY